MNHIMYNGPAAYRMISAGDAEKIILQESDEFAFLRHRKIFKCCSGLCSKPALAAIPATTIRS